MSDNSFKRGPHAAKNKIPEDILNGKISAVDERKTIVLDEDLENVDFDDKVWLYWKRNRNFIILTVTAALAIIVGVQGWKMYTANRASSMASGYEIAHSTNDLHNFAKSNAGTKLGALAMLEWEPERQRQLGELVAQLSETCAVAIGENAELARAAAYYHDVGKLKQPDCFTENQVGYNVHDELMPELSADIIRSHAKDGYELLTAARFPKIIADVAREHHGTLPIKYFYNKAMKLSGGDVNIDDYSYLGPTPQSKIAAIVMIADASEAAARALGDRSPAAVERVVRSIIEERMDLDQFAQCDITIRELTVIKQTLVEALSGVHHHRVEYPAIRFNRARQAVQDEKKE